MAEHPIVFGVQLIPPQPVDKRKMKPKKGGWTDEQIELLIKMYPDSTNEELAEALGKSRRAIYSRASLLKLKKSKHFMTQKAHAVSKRRWGKNEAS